MPSNPMPEHKLSMERARDVIFQIWDLEREWNELHDPQWTWYGSMTFRRLPMHLMKRSVEITRRAKRLRFILRKEIGWLKYLHFTLFEGSFIKKYLSTPNLEKEVWKK